MIEALLTRRALLGGATLAIAGIGTVHGQTGSDQSAKIKAWVDHTLRAPDVPPMTNGRLLDFPADTVQRRQIGSTSDGVRRLFAVVIPSQRDGIILAAGDSKAKTFNIHRTGLHLRRVSSARNLGGELSRWSGHACDDDFREQVKYWVALPLG